MATNFNPSLGSYVLNKFPSISQWSDTGPSWLSCLYVSNILITIYREENDLGNGENAGYHHFVLFPNRFSGGRLSHGGEVEIMW